MIEAADAMKRGEWLQLFPEARCYTEMCRLTPMRWGVGKLVADAALDARLNCKHCASLTSASTDTATAATAASGGAVMTIAAADTDTALDRTTVIAASKSFSSGLLNSSAVGSGGSGSGSGSDGRDGAAGTECDVCRETAAAPAVLPFVHTGMQNIIPLGTMRPRTGQSVRVLIGEPIYFNDLISRYAQLCRVNNGWGDPFPPPRELLYLAITQRIEQRMSSLTADLHRRIGQPCTTAISTSRTTGIVTAGSGIPSASDRQGSTAMDTSKVGH